jgi:hypothetical protein
MICRDAQLELPEAALAAPEATLALHLAGCRDCASELDALRRTVARVRTAGPGVPAARPSRSALLVAAFALAALVVVMGHREPRIEPGTTLDPRIVAPEAPELLSRASVLDLARVEETEERTLLEGPAPAALDPALDNLTTIASLEGQDLERALDRLAQ